MEGVFEVCEGRIGERCWGDGDVVVREPGSDTWRSEGTMYHAKPVWGSGGGESSDTWGEKFGTESYRDGNMV